MHFVFPDVNTGNCVRYQSARSLVNRGSIPLVDSSVVSHIIRTECNELEIFKTVH